MTKETSKEFRRGWTDATATAVAWLEISLATLTPDDPARPGFARALDEVRKLASPPKYMR